MKDFLNNELSVGDSIVYCTRRSSYMELKKTKILDIRTNEDIDEYLVCENPNYKSKEDQINKFNEMRQSALIKNPNNSYWANTTKPIYYTYPKTVRLSISDYIVKL